MTARLALTVPAALAALLLCLGTVEMDRLRGDLRQLEQWGAQSAALTTALQAAHQGALEARLAESEGLEASRAQEVRDRERLERLWRETRESVGSLAVELHNLRRVQEERAAALASELGQVSELGEEQRRFAQRLDEAARELALLLALAEDHTRRADRLELAMAEGRDSAELWRKLMAPVVQIAGRYTVGSGVLLASQPRPEGGHRTYLLTAWHVVRDVQTNPDHPRDPVPVAIYLEDGGQRHETARLVAHERTLDVALLELETSEPVPQGARLASPERMARLLPFDPVTAVGCPLGNDPIPTRGQVASSRHMVDGTRYAMINAPTYIGNSGGAIFDSDSHELIGIFAKIYNHGNSRPTIVPHMGLVVPMDEIYRWLSGEGYRFDPLTAGLRTEPARVAEPTPGPRDVPTSALPASSPRDSR